MQQSAVAEAGGNGATIACNANGNSGIVTLSNFSSASSTGIAFQITSTSGLPGGIEDLTPLGEAMSLSFTNVGFSFGSTLDFTITDGDGDFTLTGEAEFGSTPTLTGTLMLLLQPTFASIGGADDGGQLFSGAISGVTGGLNVTLDPGNVTSMTGNFGLPSIGGNGGGSTGGQTPEPGTLLLLGSGLLGLSAFVRTRFGSL